MNEKTKQLIFSLLKKNPECSITSLMKLAYLVDLISVERYKKQVSNFKYRRYYYGPFDSKIYLYIEDLINKKIIIPKSDYTITTGKEFVVYSPSESSDYNSDKINSKELMIIDELLESVKGYGARALTEIAYRTKPMIALGAKTNNSKGIGLRLKFGKR